jgi:AAA+ ATPase superfamily predicted ATPase
MIKVFSRLAMDRKGFKTMKSATDIVENPQFIGRKFELDLLRDISSKGSASIIVVYGRRRVGKTELLEQAFRDRNVLKFEGIEGQDKAYQIRSFCQELAIYAEEPKLAEKECFSWREALQLLVSYIKKGQWTLYLEELQWLACGETELIAELKYFWDNYFRRNPELILILCGSSRSFMVEKVLHSKALYNRSQYEIALKPLKITETFEFFGPKYHINDVVSAHLTVGGMPLYLQYLKDESSIFVGLCKNSFRTGSFFVGEIKRIFTSSLGVNEDYQKIIEILAERRFATRDDIAAALSVKSGGSFTAALNDLELAGFVESYTPFDLGEKSKLLRYSISDPYLRFYFSFIAPLEKKIENGDFNFNPVSALSLQQYRQWLGYEYERLCRLEHGRIAQLLGFNGVKYRYGSFFNRAMEKEDRGLQLDLVFDREDNVLTVCEIKFGDIKNIPEIAQDLNRKVTYLSKKFPPPHKIQTVLITGTVKVSKQQTAGIFDQVLNMEDLFPTLG